MEGKKIQAKKNLNKGDSLTCEVCGLTVTVDENHAYTEGSMVMCCGESMKPKARKASPAKK